MENLFTNYINHFYEQKRLASSIGDKVLKQISKDHLNTLYGIFGRKPDRLNTIGATPGQEWDVVSKY